MTVGAQTAGIRCAWIHTAFVLAVLITRTVIVACTLGARNFRDGYVCCVAFDAWITLVTSRTTALRVMITRVTLSVNAAPFQATGVQTAAMQTYLGASALCIMLTAAGDDDSLDRHTVARVIGDSVAGTLADHGAQWQCVQDCTALLWTADMWCGAWIFAALINTCQFRWAVGVLCTLRLWITLGFLA